MIQILAPAKINLGLEILGKRSDAYHEIRTIFCTVSLFDRVQVTATAKANFQVNGPEIVGENLAEMAIRMAHASHASLPPAGFIIDKRIPLAAGLGGASSDAAAALLGLNRISPQLFTPGDLMLIALQCGSDVPFLLDGGLMLGRGRGDQLEPLPYRSMFAVVIVPHITIADKTRSMFGHIRPADWTDGSRVEASASRLRNGRDVQEADLANAFQRPLFDLFPGVRSIAADAESALARSVQISGAGPAMYVLAPDLVTALRDAHKVRQFIQVERARVYCVRSTSRILIQESPHD